MKNQKKKEKSQQIAVSITAWKKMKQECLDSDGKIKNLRQLVNIKNGLPKEV